MVMEKWPITFSDLKRDLSNGGSQERSRDQEDPGEQGQGSGPAVQHSPN